MKYSITVWKYKDGTKLYARNTDPVRVMTWGGEKTYWMPVPRTENQKSALIDLLPYE